MVETTSSGAEEVPRGLQNIFDFVARKLLEQGQKSRGVEIEGEWKAHVCAYRGPDGLKCAAGHLMPDHIYRRDMEGVTIGDIVWFEDTFDDDEQTLIFCLQRMHDGYDPGLWAQRLDSIARAREVETYVVDEFLLGNP